MSPSSRTFSTPSLSTAATSTATASSATVVTSPRCCRGLLTMLLLATLLGLTTSASLLDKVKYPKSRELQTCANNNSVSAICYHCASLHPQDFTVIHEECCEVDGRIRAYCELWYTEEPKRGRRDMWYY